MTFHASYNCGSMLQAYALQNVLKDRYGAECEIIDFSNLKQKRMYSILYKPRTIKDIFRNILNVIFYKKIRTHVSDYIKFKKENLSLSVEHYTSLYELDSAQIDYDIVIAGSDQVWNIKARDFDDAYFLPFVKSGKRIAYAVSLGATNPNIRSKNEKYKEYVQKFDGISVREKNAQKWIQELSGQNVEICVDPTLLLEPQYWDELSGKK